MKNKKKKSHTSSTKKDKEEIKKRRKEKIKEKKKNSIIKESHDKGKKKKDIQQNTCEKPLQDTESALKQCVELLETKRKLQENDVEESPTTITKNSSTISASSDFIKNYIERKIPNVGRNLQTSLCIAIPSTIINHKQDVVKAYVTSYLARVCTIFSVEKIYIYDDQLRYEQELKNEKSGNCYSWKYDKTKGGERWNNTSHDTRGKKDSNAEGGEMSGIDEYSYLCKFMHCNLQYLETPQYLRKHLFPITPFLKNTGIMNPVDAPHHLRSDEWLPFREGAVVEKRENGLVVDVGLFSNVFVETDMAKMQERQLQVGTRVTVLFDEKAYYLFEKRHRHKNILFTGRLVSPRLPYMYNVYWGYTVEVLKNVSDIFLLNFDYIVGTSERGSCVNCSNIFEKGKSILIVFGNRSGLEDLLIREEEEKKQKQFSIEEREKTLKTILEKFDFFINTCPFQTSRTIRTEEALTITLSLIHNVLK